MTDCFRTNCLGGRHLGDPKTFLKFFHFHPHQQTIIYIKGPRELFSLGAQTQQIKIAFYYLSSKRLPHFLPPISNSPCCIRLPHSAGSVPRPFLFLLAYWFGHRRLPLSLFCRPSSGGRIIPRCLTFKFEGGGRTSFGWFPVEFSQEFYAPNAANFDFGWFPGFQPDVFSRFLRGSNGVIMWKRGYFFKPNPLASLPDLCWIVG
jgi:hypothetical protein